MKEFRPEYFNFGKDLEVNVTFHGKAYKPKVKIESKKEPEKKDGKMNLIRVIQ